MDFVSFVPYVPLRTLYLYHIQMKLSIHFFFIRVILSLFGITLCGFLAMKYIGWIQLPCSSEICTQLEKDPIQKILPLPVFGLVYYCVQIWASFRVENSLGRQVLSGMGAILSVGFTLYASQKYDGVCPYCFASAVCCLSLLVYDLLPVKLEKEFGWRHWIFAVGVSFGLLGVLIFTQARSTIQLQRLRLTDKYLSERAVAVSHSEWIAFVDLECSTCRRLLENMNQRQLHFSVVMVTHRNEFSVAQSLGFYSQRSIEGRSKYLRQILRSPSLPLSAVERTFGKISPDARQRLEEDRRLAAEIDVRATPVVIRRDGSGWKKVALDQLL